MNIVGILAKYWEPGRVKTRLATHLGDETAATARLYPALAPWLAPGRTLTRLDHTYFSADEMTGSLLLADAPTDAEFRRVGGVWQGALPLEWLLWLGLPGLGGAWNRWRARRRN
mgnify:CR=1 FL=1